MTDRGSGPRDDDRPRDDQDLAELVDELSTTLESLQGVVGPGDRGRPRRRGPTDPRIPTPPTPRELVRFTEQYTIPTLIALLESGVRSLELLRATLRLLDGRGIEAASPETRERVESVGRTTLDRIDAVLSDLGSAVEGGEPSDPDARDLLADARALREEIDRRLREVEAGERDRDDERDWDGTARRTSGRVPTRGHEIPVRSADEEEEGDASEGDDAPAVDVEAELDTIRRDLKGEGNGDLPAADEGEGETDPDDEDRNRSR
ncbi:hypothetical protein ACFQE8_20630 [Salinirubellus sp. GCM10025818]|uniref:DUF7547 family protein n=1 Tax=Salinirubellus TaxID=2162630 RepID=UPI0030CC7624